ncbi:MAG: hypothetical protein HY011_25890, partial [Acidobacteria bacterium]|nr:hypothetical protein [Acidobacteriota bacterium]
MTSLRSISNKPLVKSGLPFGWLTVAVLLLSFIWTTSPTKHFFAAASSKTSPPAQGVIASPTHKLAAAYYSLKDNLRATLMLSNQGPNVIPLQITLFSKQGTRLNVPATSLRPHEVRAFDLRQIAAWGVEEGNLQVEYQGRPLEVGGVVTMVDTARSLIFDEELAEPAKGFASARLEGVWWRPTGSAELQLALTNTTDAPLTVALAAGAEGAGDSGNLTFKLEAHATHVLSTEAKSDNEKLNLNGVAGGLSIKHSGAPGALIAHGYIQEASKGFSNVIEFSDPQKAKSARLDGTGLRIEAIAGQELSQIAVLRNVGATALVVKGRLPYTLTDGTQDAADLPAQKLAPGEVRRLELTPVIARLSRGAVVAAAGLEFTYAGEPGSLIAAALSLSNDRNQVFRVPMRDAAVQSSSTGEYPWNFDNSSS